jgi:antitoxin MazE
MVEVDTMSSETQIAKWGNSLAVRIPRSIAKDARLAEGDQLSLDLDANGNIVLRPARKKYDLGQLVAGITAGNRHGETDWGPAVGEESWG